MFKVGARCFERAPLNPGPCAGHRSPPRRKKKKQTRQRTSRQSHQSNNFELGGGGQGNSTAARRKRFRRNLKLSILAVSRISERLHQPEGAREGGPRSMGRSASCEPCASRPFSQAPDSERVQMKRAKSAWKPWKPYGNRPVNRQQSLDTVGNRTFHGGVLRYHLLSLENARFPTVSNDSWRFPGRFASGFHGFQ